MNKKQIETIGKEYVNIQIETNNYKSDMLNMNQIDFPMEGLVVIHEDKKDVFIQIKDIRLVRGVRL